MVGLVSIEGLFAKPPDNIFRIRYTTFLREKA